MGQHSTKLGAAVAVALGLLAAFAPPQWIPLSLRSSGWVIASVLFVLLLFSLLLTRQFRNLHLAVRKGQQMGIMYAILLGALVGGISAPIALCILPPDEPNADIPRSPVMAGAIMPGDGELPRWGIQDLGHDDTEQLLEDLEIPDVVRKQLTSTIGDNGLWTKEIKKDIQDAVDNPDSMFVFLGNTVCWTDKPHMKVVSYEDDPMIELDKTESGGVTLTAKMFDAGGKMVCHIEQNRFVLGGGRYTFWGPHQNILRVFENAKEVLRIEFINNRAIRILGEFYLRDGVIAKIEQKRQTFGSREMSACVAGRIGKSAINVTKAP